MELMKYIQQAKEEYIKAYEAIDKETVRHDEDLKKYKEKSQKYTVEAANKEWKKINSEHSNIMQSIDAELKAAIEKITIEYEKEVHAFYQAKGEQLDDNDIKLLNSGLPLTESEIAEMVSRHADNTTMIRLIKNYVRNNKIEVRTEIKRSFAKVNKAGEPELLAFKAFKNLAGNAVKMALGGMAGTQSYISCADKLEEYVADTEKRLKNAKVYLDEATRAELQEMQRQ